MPQFKEWKGWFYHPQRRLSWKAPLLDWTTTRETEEPFRIGKSVIVRLWPATLGLVIGRWRSVSPYDEDTSLLLALQSCPGQLKTKNPTWCEDCGRDACNCPVRPADQEYW